VMDDAPAMAEMMADMTGPGEGGDQDAELRVVSNLPRDAKLEIELPEAVANRMSLPRRLYTRHTVNRKRVVRGPLTPHGVSRLGLVRLSAGERQTIRLRVDIPKKHRKRKYEVALVQLHRGIALGRYTWRLVPKKGN